MSFSHATVHGLKGQLGRCPNFDTPQQSCGWGCVGGPVRQPWPTPTEHVCAGGRRQKGLPGYGTGRSIGARPGMQVARVEREESFGQGRPGSVTGQVSVPWAPEAPASRVPAEQDICSYYETRCGPTGLRIQQQLRRTRRLRGGSRDQTTISSIASAPGRTAATRN